MNVKPDNAKLTITNDETTLQNVVCTSCDGFCPVAVKVENGQVVKVTTRFCIYRSFNFLIGLSRINVP
mgnify:CR=1 FL=1